MFWMKVKPITLPLSPQVGSKFADKRRYSSLADLGHGVSVKPIIELNISDDIYIIVIRNLR
jgi:hypothetical protein